MKGSLDPGLKTMINQSAPKEQWWRLGARRGGADPRALRRSEGRDLATGTKD